MKKWIRPITGVLLCLWANCGILMYRYPQYLISLLCLVVATNTLPLLAQDNPFGKQLWFLTHGHYCLRIFLAAALVSIPCQGFIAWYLLPENLWQVVTSGAVCLLVLLSMFFNGMCFVYATSYQLGLKLRIIGFALCLIPIANLVVLLVILHETAKEIRTETEKELLNRQREAQQICKTKYPILLVHGVFFRDFKYFGYWGRIPKQLTRNGATVFFGNHPSAAPISQCAEILTRRVMEIVEQTGCEKVNIIAHSKGGLDCRYAIEYCGMAPYVASLTTMSTPHRGSKFADYMLAKLPKFVQRHFSRLYDLALNKLGEPEADLMSAVKDLTTEHCKALDAAIPLPEGILCRSYGSKLNRASGGRFPMNFTFMLAKYIDGPNDGLVGEDSFAWGSEYTYLTTTARHGISHCDMTDLNRANLSDFDVRELYVRLVADLKERGL